MHYHNGKKLLGKSKISIQKDLESSYGEIMQMSMLVSNDFAFQIDLLAILQKILDRALFLYNFIRELRSSGVRSSITIVHIRKFYRM